MYKNVIHDRGYIYIYIYMYIYIERDLFVRYKLYLTVLKRKRIMNFIVLSIIRTYLIYDIKLWMSYAYGGNI